MQRLSSEGLNLNDKVIAINRVAKVVKGGKRFSFSALVVVGDGQGHVGVGQGKAREVPEAIRKGIDQAKKHLIFVPIQHSTIPSQVTGHYGAETVLLKPAADGAGIIAGGPVRAIMEMAGVRNILSKCLGGGNAVNVVKATMDGLLQLKDLEQVSQVRRSQGVDDSNDPEPLPVSHEGGTS